MVEWILGGMSSLTSGLGVLLGYKNYQLMKEMSKLNLLSQLYTNQRDYSLNREVLDFNKQMINLQMEREDNAVQRRVEDLKKAGMSPILAVGQPANSGVYQTSFAPSTAPILGEAPQFDVGSISQFAAVLGDLAIKKEQANLLKTQSKFTDIQAGLASIEMKFKEVEKSLDLILKEKGVEAKHYEIEKLKAEIPNLEAQLKLLTQQGLLTKKQVDFFEAERNAITVMKEKIQKNKNLSEREKMFYIILLDSLDVIKGILKR
jgi:hypothetical protein